MMELILPKSWNEITLAQYVELNSIEHEQYNTPFSIILEKLAIITDSSSDDDIWEEMDVEELRKKINSCKFLLERPTPIFKNKIYNDQYILMNFMNMTIGEFIDIDFFQRDGQEKNLHKISAIIFRKYKTGEWGEIILEPYSKIDLNERAEEFLDLPALELIGALNSFNEFKNNFMNSYKPLFEPTIEDDDSIPLDELDEISRQEIEEDMKFEEKMQKWSWTKFVFEISGRDILKVEKVYDLGLVHTFNILAMKQDLNIN